MRILFVTSNRIGDAVLTCGLLNQIILRHPDARITLVCGPVAEGLFAHTPNIVRIITIEKRHHGQHWLELWRQVVTSWWDLVVDLRASALSYLVPTWRRAIQGARRGHKIAQIGAVLRLDPPPLPVVWVAAKDHALAAQLLPPGGPIIALGPTANWNGKIWPAAYFVDLFRQLAAGPLPGAQAVVLAGPGAQERAMATPLLRALPKALDFCGTLSLSEAAACLQRATLFFGNDSGLMHLAAASGAPTVGLFGPTAHAVAEYTPAGPYGIAAVADGPEMADLSVQTALAAAQTLLARVAAGQAATGADYARPKNAKRNPRR